MSGGGLQNTLSAFLQRGKTPHLNECPVAHSVGAVEYTECISSEGQDSPNECLASDTK